MWRSRPSVLILHGFSFDGVLIHGSQVFKALHMAFYSSISNPFLKLDAPIAPNDQYPFLHVGGAKWKSFRRRVDEISRVVGTATPASDNR